jgi:phosphoserine phosphatase RsbU/P
VSGTGITAALLMASLKASLRGQALWRARTLGSDGEREPIGLQRIHEQSIRYLLLYGEYDVSSRVLAFVNGGHNPPLILRGGEVLRLEAGGPVIGLLPGATYWQARIQLEPGDVFIGYTDGITEALNEGEEEWEERRLIAAVRQCAGLRAAQTIQWIFAR